VNASGTWRLDGTAVVLERTALHPAESPDADVPIPDLLLEDRGEGWILAERLGDETCPYRRGTTTLNEP
jgi:hypothetical protein